MENQELRYTALKALILCVLCAAALGMSGKARATDENIETFADMGDFSNSKALKNFVDSTNKTGCNLMIRSDPNDASGASDQIVSKNGSEKWDLGLTYIAPDNKSYIGAWANNNNSLSNNWLSWGYTNLNGYLSGRMASWTGSSKPVEAFIVHDFVGDGIGNLVGGNFDMPGDDGEVYTSKDILIGDKQLRGDLEAYPDYNSGDSPLILPKMIICPAQEGDPYYSNGVRVGNIMSLSNDGGQTFSLGKYPYSTLDDLAEMGENWLRQDCGAANYWCAGADWDTNGEVDLIDFAKLALRLE